MSERQSWWTPEVEGAVMKATEEARQWQEHDQSFKPTPEPAAKAGDPVEFGCATRPDAQLLASRLTALEAELRELRAKLADGSYSAAPVTPRGTQAMSNPKAPAREGEWRRIGNVVYLPGGFPPVQFEERFPLAAERLRQHLNAHDATIAALRTQLAAAEGERDTFQRLHAYELNRAQVAEARVAAAAEKRAELADWLLERLTVATFNPGTEREYTALAEPHHGNPLEPEEIADMLYEWLALTSDATGQQP